MAPGPSNTQLADIREFEFFKVIISFISFFATGIAFLFVAARNEYAARMVIGMTVDLFIEQNHLTKNFLPEDGCPNDP